MTPKKTLGEFIIENQNQFEYSTGELSRLLNAIRLASKAVNHEVNKAGLVDIIGATDQINHSDIFRKSFMTFLWFDIFVGRVSIDLFFISICSFKRMIGKNIQLLLGFI
jgi:hypothetical protein